MNRGTNAWIILSLAIAVGCAIMGGGVLFRGFKTQAELHIEQARAHQQAGRYTDAIVACRTAIAMKPDYAEAYEVMSFNYSRLGQNTEAVAAYKQIIAFHPDSHFAYYWMGKACFSLAQNQNAIIAFKGAVALRPDYTDAYYEMGNAYESLRQNALAINAFEKVIALEPKGKNTDLARIAIERLRKQ